MPKKDLQKWLHAQLFQQVPVNIAVIDRDYQIVEANQNFADKFGDWNGRKCYSVYKRRRSPCERCAAAQTFIDGIVRISDEAGVDRRDRHAHYIVHTAPIIGQSGEVEYVIEMSTDVTATREWQREYQLLFDRVPCYVTVIDRDYRIVRANAKFRETFGDLRGEYCYRAYKKRNTKCKNCPASRTFKDGGEHHGSHRGVTRQGDEAYYMVSTSALSRPGDPVSHVIEIATDVTDMKVLDEKLETAHGYLQSVIKTTTDGIIAVDADGRTVIFNPAARKLLGYPPRKRLRRAEIEKMLPAEFQEVIQNRKGSFELPEVELTTTDGETVPVRLAGGALYERRRYLGTFVLMQDLRQIKSLEKEKLDAERLAAVGQTVAGLAHSVKNILMGLEGGMYMVDSGLKRQDQDRIAEGWEVLERNFAKTTSLVKDFLSFAKGRLPHVQWANPNDLVQEIVDLYAESAKQLGITLTANLAESMKPVPLDPDGIHTCLTNLVSNAIDACQMSEVRGDRVEITARETKSSVIIEVTDNGTGIEYDIKKKIFTTFFTTKGGEGTGLGLLTTRKIVQEHGGYIAVESEPGAGSTFRMEFPRKRLPKPEPESDDKSTA